MARKPTDGTKSKGIVAKNGFLYITKSEIHFENGEKKYKKAWVTTGLPNTPENVKKAKALRENLLSKGHQDDTKLKGFTMDEVVEIFLSQQRRSLRDTTYTTYSYNCAHIAKFFHGIRVSELKTEDIEAFYDYLLTLKDTRKGSKSPDGKLIHQRTFRDIRARLKDVFNLAIEKEIIVKNPCVKAKVSKELYDSSQIVVSEDDTFFSYSEAKSFLKKADEYFHRYEEDAIFFEIFYFALYLALRREEVLGLKWSAVNLEKKTLLICGTITKTKPIVFHPYTKTTDQRSYPLTDEQVKLLCQMKEREDKMRVLFGDKYVENDFVFKKADGSCFYPDTLSDKFKDFIEKNKELPQKVTFHKLRRSCVSILIHMGYDVKAAQKWVGHKDPSTTIKWYAAAKDKESKQEVSEGLKDLYIPNSLL